MAAQQFPARIRSTPARRLLLKGLALTACIGAVVLLAVSRPVGASAPQVTLELHQDADRAGSTIRAHEGGMTASTTFTTAVSGIRGLDVSGWQGNVNWYAAWQNGARFAYVKATEGTGYTNSYFAQQYNGSYNVGMIRGAYHFARPNLSSGATQADYFVNHGGGWSRDGKTLPPMLDIEYNPYGSTCYGYSHSGMINWLWSFVNRMRYRTGRYVTIYTTTSWWTTCTGNYGGFAAYSPLFIARYTSTPGLLPAGWGFYTFWQYSDSGIFPGDQDTFNGSYDRLVALARG
jgi:GH25 family lysozyme M1 (1,4-beta-N-acetylmuramidase)